MSKPNPPMTLITALVALKGRGGFCVLVPPMSATVRKAFRDSGLELPPEVGQSWFDPTVYLTRKGADNAVERYRQADPDAGEPAVIEYSADEIRAAMKLCARAA